MRNKNFIRKARNDRQNNKTSFGFLWIFEKNI